MAKAPIKPLKPKTPNRFKVVVVLFCVIVALSIALAGAIMFVRNSKQPHAGQSWFQNFTVKSITVNGNTQYDNNAIIGESGLKVGQSIFSVNKATAAKNIQAAFPYVQTATVKNSSYNTLTIDIVETEVVGAMYGDGQWLVVGANGKILETFPMESDHPGRYFYLQGAVLAETAEIGATAMDERSIGIVNTILAALKQNNIEGVLGIDMRDKTRISFNWKNQLTVVLGNESNLETEISLFAQSLPGVLEHNGGSVSGQLDFSSYSDNTDANDKIIYTPKDVLENE